MADREKEINSVKALLRAVLQSNKGGVSRHRLLGEYRGITGDLLPYRELGFENVEDFMRAIPDCVTFGHNKDGEPVYLPVADAKSAHIQRMVSAQKGKKARRGKHLQGNSRRPGKSQSAVYKKLARSPRARFSSSWQRNSPSSYGSTSRQQHGQGKPTQGRSSYSHGSGTPGRYSSLEVTINTDRAGQILQTVNRFPNTAYWMPAPSIPLITQWQIPPQEVHSPW